MYFLLLLKRLLLLVLFVPVALVVISISMAIIITYPWLAITVFGFIGTAYFMEDSAAVIAIPTTCSNVRALVSSRYQAVTSFITLPEIRYIIRRSFEYPFLVPAHHHCTSSDPASSLVKVNVFQWFLITIRFWLSDLCNAVYAALPSADIFLVSILSMLAVTILKFVVLGALHSCVNHQAMKIIVKIQEEPEVLEFMDMLLMLIHVMFAALYIIHAIVPVMKLGSIMNKATKMALESRNAITIQPLLPDDADNSQSVTPMPTPDESPGTPNTSPSSKGDHECCECKNE